MINSSLAPKEEEYQGIVEAMVDRFIGHDGKQSNLPTARFGNISRMDGEPIEDKYGIRQDSFLVDIRSISGYSGSPVFVYINQTLARPPPFIAPPSHPYRQGLHGPWLMGVDWCHLKTFGPVLERDQLGEPQQSRPRRYVELNSGIAGVIPAWKIQEVLAAISHQRSGKRLLPLA